MTASMTYLNAASSLLSRYPDAQWTNEGPFDRAGCKIVKCTVTADKRTASYSEVVKDHHGHPVPKPDNFQLGCAHIQAFAGAVEKLMAGKNEPKPNRFQRLLTGCAVAVVLALCVAWLLSDKANDGPSEEVRTAEYTQETIAAQKAAWERQKKMLRMMDYSRRSERLQLAEAK